MYFPDSTLGTLYVYPLTSQPIVGTSPQHHNRLSLLSDIKTPGYAAAMH